LALESNNAEMTKRLKYTKDILTHMLNNNNGAGGSIKTPSTAGANIGSANMGGGMGGTYNVGSSKRGVESAGSMGDGMGSMGQAPLSSVRKPLNVIN